MLERIHTTPDGKVHEIPRYYTATNGKKYKLIGMEEVSPGTAKFMVDKGYLPARYKMEDENGKRVTAAKKTEGGPFEIIFYGG